MARRSEFVVVPSPAKPPLAVKRSRAQPPKIDIEHRSLGIGKLVGLRASGSGGFVCDIKFGSITRTLKLEQSYFITSVAEMLALLPTFPQARPKAEPVEKKKSESADESEEETAELDAEGAFLGEQSAVEDNGDEGNGDGDELEEIA
jgi:hypothetical protein